MNDNGNVKTENTLVRLTRKTFIGMGVLPFLILIATVIFAILSDNFLTVRNLLNVARQSTYLIIVTAGQMLALLTGGFDLSVGTIVALSSVVGAMAMSAMNAAFPDSVALVIIVGLLAGLGAGLSVGTINGIGVSVFNVNPFMMTLGMSSVGFGIALYLTGGVPVYGLPEAFSDVFGFGRLLGIPTPVFITLVTGHDHVFFSELDPDRQVFLRGRGQHQSLVPVWDQYQADPLSGVYFLQYRWPPSAVCC